MKISIEKTAQIVIDIDTERKRINKDFRGKHYVETKQKLHKLMDLIEQCLWDEAATELESKWWKGYDDKAFCPRIEFVGLAVGLYNISPFFSSWISYADLVYSFVNYPKNYRVVGTEGVKL